MGTEEYGTPGPGTPVPRLPVRDALGWAREGLWGGPVCRDPGAVGSQGHWSARGGLMALGRQEQPAGEGRMGSTGAEPSSGGRWLGLVPQGQCMSSERAIHFHWTRQ